MLRSVPATSEHAVFSCPQCTHKIVQGQSVLELQPAVVYHEICIRGVLPKKPSKTLAPKKIAVEEIAAVYHATRRTRAQTLAWLEETAPDSDLMRWTPSHSLSE